MAQWWERSPPTNVARVQFLSSAMCGLVLAKLNSASLRKTNISIFQFDQDRGPTWKPVKADVASSLNIVVYLFFRIFFY